MYVTSTLTTTLSKVLLTLQLSSKKKLRTHYFHVRMQIVCFIDATTLPAHERVYIRLFQRENSYSKKEEGFLYSYKIIVKKA